MQQHNGDIQQQQPHSLSLLKIPAPSLSTFSSKSTPVATTSSSNIGGGGGDYSIANCNNSPQQQTLFTTERLRQMGVINWYGGFLRHLPYRILQQILFANSQIQEARHRFHAESSPVIIFLLFPSTATAE